MLHWRKNIWHEKTVGILINLRVFSELPSGNFSWQWEFQSFGGTFACARGDLPFGNQT